MEERKSLKRTETAHNVIMENRTRLSVSGVEDVDNFDESTVTLITAMGALTVRGMGLRINKLSVDTGEVMIEGDIDSFEYSDVPAQREGGGFISRLFK
ncbi:MAG: sporulation protein YabP [Clostridia bacterium]|nr:sporulation protein YabP [Clostridia bacterium]